MPKPFFIVAIALVHGNLEIAEATPHIAHKYYAQPFHLAHFFRYNHLFPQFQIGEASLWFCLHQMAVSRFLLGNAGNNIELAQNVLL